MQTIDYQTDPSRYRHWKIERDGDIAYLIMDVDQAGGLRIMQDHHIARPEQRDELRRR